MSVKSLYDILKQTEKMQAEQQPQLESLMSETALLWYDNMVTEGQLEQANAEIAMLWYEIMTGGVS